MIAYGPRPGADGRFRWANGARAYYATLASHAGNAGPYPATKAPEFLAVAHSDDDGVTWSAPVLATRNHPVDFNDKEWITVDDHVASPFFGRVYLSWTQFLASTATGFGSEPVMVALSTDGGRSFGAAGQLPQAGNNGTGNGRQGSSVVTGPDGSVYVAFEQGASQVVAVSRDGGARWTRPARIGPVTYLDDPIACANFRTSSFPTIAADPRPGATRL